MSGDVHVRFCEHLEGRFLRVARLVILSRGKANEALPWTKQVMTKLRLEINETKTCVRNAREERFDFLGYSFGLH